MWRPPSVVDWVEPSHGVVAGHMVRRRIGGFCAIDTRSGATFWAPSGDGPFATAVGRRAGRVFVASEGTGGRITASADDGGRIWQTTVGDCVRTARIARPGCIGVNDEGTRSRLARREAILHGERTGPSEEGRL